MKAFVFSDASFEREAGQFVWLEIDTEKAVNAPLRRKFPIQALPTFFVVDPADERVALRWVGGANISQLHALLEKGGERVRNPGATSAAAPAADRALESADRAYGAGQDSAAAFFYRAALAAAPDDWAPYGRAVESLLFALQRLDSCEAVTRLADQVYAPVRHLPSAVTVAAGGLDCALSLPAETAGRKELVSRFESRAREVLADSSLEVAADDRSSLFGSLVGAREDAADQAGIRSVALEWAAFLEKEAAAATGPAQRMVFDSHRLSAYLTLGEPERAIPMLEQSERDVPDDYNPPARLAVTYRAMKKWDEALAASDRAVARAYGPRKLGILQTRSDILLGKGDRAAARATLEEAIRTAEAFPPGQRSESTIASLRKKLQAIG